MLTKDSKSNEKFIWNIKVSVAQYYIDNLSEEVRKGQMEMLAQGQLPAQAKLGYQTTGEKGHKTHIPKQPAAMFIKEMFELYATGQYTVRRMAKVMYEKGLRSRTDQKIHQSDVHRILCDPYYYGAIRWKGALYPGKHEELISKELFDTVQNYLRRPGGSKYAKHNYLFKGAFHCRRCNCLVTWQVQKRFIYGRCSGYKPCEARKYAREDKVEKNIAPQFEIYQLLTPKKMAWLQKALREAHEIKEREHNIAVSDLKLKHEKVQYRLDRLYDDHVDGKITDQYYQRRFHEYTLEREHLLDARSVAATMLIRLISNWPQLYWN